MEQVSSRPGLIGILKQLKDGLTSQDPRFYWGIAACVLLGDAALTALITRFVSYTEIDFRTYLQQARLFAKGERDYAYITGDSGPCVYPALHLYIHALLSPLTDDGVNLLPAQVLYGAVYLLAELLSIGIFRFAEAPPMLLLLLPLSKRLHSIYVLRLFNDVWAVLAVQACILALCTRKNALGAVLFSLALNVKMNILLFAPALAIVLFRAEGFFGALRHAFTVVLVQILLALPFLLEHPRSYLSGAFNLSRAFEYKWTVNLRFLDEATFSAPRTAKVLLLAHMTVLLLWGVTRWTGLTREGPAWITRRWNGPRRVVEVPSARFIVMCFFTSNLIGIAFARSLHYQFYSWYAQSLPLLLWSARLHWIVIIGTLAAIEWCWNTFPATPTSSAVLTAAHLAILTALWATKGDDTSRDENESRQHQVEAARKAK